jgi:hypothetical protein
MYLQYAHNRLKKYKLYGMYSAFVQNNFTVSYLYLYLYVNIYEKINVLKA